MSDIGIPNPKNFHIRPINKGMISELAPNQIAPGSFLLTSNYIPSLKGLKRRPGYLPYSGGNQVASESWPLLDIAPIWTAAGLNAAALITNKYLYAISGFVAPAIKYWTYSTGSLTMSSATATGSGTAWNTAANRIVPGDVIILDANGSGDGPEEATISAINSDTEIVLTAAPTGTYGAGTDYIIRKRFHISDDTFFDHTVCSNSLLISDHKRPGLYKYNGTSLAEWSATLFYVPGCVTFFSDRVWIGNTIESNNYYRQRIRWSSATDQTSFDAADYYDIPYTDGFIRRIVPLGRLLVAYFENAIYLGRPSNYVNLPFQFDTRIDSGRTGLVGTRAITSAINGHFFVGQDDVYYLDVQGGLNSLNCPVWHEMMDGCSKPEHIYAITDQENDRVAFGVPGGGEYIEKIWSYNYKTKSWSCDVLDAEFLSAPLLDLGLTWDDLTATLAPNNNWDTGMASYGSWDAISGPKLVNPVFHGGTGYIYFFSPTATGDNGTAITGTIITPDFDFDVPDEDKTISRITLRLAKRASGELRFTTHSSDDGGNTWTARGTIVIAENELEGKVDFSVTGSILRFKLTENSTTLPYELSEMTMRVLNRGLEYEFE